MAVSFPRFLRVMASTAILLLLTISASAQSSSSWKEAYLKAEQAVSQLTLTDKVNVLTARCIGNTFAVPSIDFPGFCLEDSPLGVRLASNVSAFPAAINAASTFNRTLMRQRGEAMGAEFRGKGVNVALGPMMNLMRAPAAGRNWEGFGADPYLSGEGAFETITGMQSQGVQATAKHFVNNEQEHFRTTSTSDVDDRFFLRSVQAEVAAIMCSYNQINGTYACENDKTINGILKGEFGFQGYVMSDWGATHTTARAVLSGLDVTMPGDRVAGTNSSFFGTTLVSSVQNGTVPESRVDDMALRTLAAWYKLGQDQGYPPVNFDSHNNSAADDERVDVQGDHKVLIREIGKASTVLLKNTAGALPLTNIKTIGIIGNGAGPAARGPNGFPNRQGDDGVLAMGWGSGTATFPYLITPLDAITARAAQDGSTVTSSLSDTDLAAAATVASGKDVALVFITADSGEGSSPVEGNAGDRNNLQAWHNGDALVQQVAQSNLNTVVVVNSVGPIVVEAWIDHPNVTALVWSGLPGQEAGNSVTDVIYGAYNPSGRLPYTIGKSITDYPAQVIYTSPTPILSIPYSEGIFIDYRHFDAAGIAPRFEFGFGLSYTTFVYSGLSVRGSPRGGQAPTGPGSSLDPWLHDPVITVHFTVKNTGKVAGHEIPQLYVSLPASTNSPPRVLKGFDSVFITPGQTQGVTIQLSRFDVAMWDVVQQRWQVPAGKIGISIGASSRDIRLTGSL
ncbi:glycoside hydrolase family 3 protein [Mycena albidolilacea]|uniref:beta-glucosidase n=1 Tax=Mycena albidolilacea TaxID=1033008 RepID=A0AAD7F678_9AGAR|nr:glycoside hydrolase family 3 protein [Mycena albidolilacea]